MSPTVTYGAINTCRSAAFTASNSSADNWARSAVLNGFNFAWIKVIAVNIPSKEPIGLNACARFRRRVAVLSSPMVRMYGLELVSRKESPQVKMK